MTMIPLCPCGLPEGVKGLPHQDKCPYYTSVSSDLSELVNAILDLRGDPKEWSKKYNLVHQFIADLPLSNRVFCRGEVRIKDVGHYPACLVYDPQEERAFAWAPSGADGTMVRHDEKYFFSDIPYVSIAKESLSGGATSKVVVR